MKRRVRKQEKDVLFGGYVARWKIVLRVKILHPLNGLLLSDLWRRRWATCLMCESLLIILDSSWMQDLDELLRTNGMAVVEDKLKRVEGCLWNIECHRRAWLPNCGCDVRLSTVGTMDDDSCGRCQDKFQWKNCKIPSSPPRKFEDKCSVPDEYERHERMRSAVGI